MISENRRVRGKGRSKAERLDELIGRVLLRWLSEGVPARDPAGGGPLLGSSGNIIMVEPSAAHVAVALRFIQLHRDALDQKRSRGMADKVEESIRRLREANGQVPAWA